MQTDEQLAEMWAFHMVGWRGGYLEMRMENSLADGWGLNLEAKTELETAMPTVASWVERKAEGLGTPWAVLMDFLKVDQWVQPGGWSMDMLRVARWVSL